MPKINFNEAESYSSGGSFFGLSDDGKVAQVQFLIDNEDDIEVYATHKVEVSGKTVTVNCLREPGASIDDCPLCKAKHGVSVGVYVRLIHDNRIKIWSRGKTFYQKFANLVRRYKPLSSHTIEIERVGKSGDPSTSYDFYDIDTVKNVKNKNDLLKDFSDDEIKQSEIFGNYVKDYSYEQLENYLDSGNLGDDAPVRKRNSRGNDEHGGRTTEQNTRRRRPVETVENEEDAY